MDKGAFKYTFTVFTPTYNRVDLLPRAYESLKNQTFRDFEWIVVDDGSTDGTDTLVQEWLETSSFSIRYTWQPNSGKHVAINRGVEKAQGYLFAILDSDDWYAPRALERFLYHWESIPDEKKPGFSGVVGLYAYPSGRIVGTKFPHDILDSDSIEIRTRYRVKGDNIAAHCTEVMREFPFPEDLGKYVTPGLVWNRRALRYASRYVNEIFAYTEYQPGGLSDKIVVNRAKAPDAARLYYKEFISMGRPLPIDIALRNYANYVRYSLHAGIALRKQILDAPSELLWSISFLLGASLYLRDRITLRRKGLK
ncbi:MAG: glycosyltransferase family 2 protein [candidate division WOR-3 bacterium]|nr:glycosyltransferase family 2 protein [candidate division WOR-3 bacterium]